MVIMKILGLSIDTTAKTPILLLQEEGDGRMLPIWVGSMEAMNISLALSGKSGPRPLTHDLTLAIIESLGASVTSLEITNFSNGTFYADLVLRHEEQLQRMDCRPSDGITLALKLGLPIYVHEDVLENATHAEQRQDAASFHVLREDDLKDFKDLQSEKTNIKNIKISATPEPSPAAKPAAPASKPSISIKKKGPRIQHVTMTVQPKAHVKTLIDAKGEEMKEQDIEKLLNNLEPASNTRM